jgi:hypothetical protein
MSITLHDSPQALTPVYNDMMFVAGSTLASQQYFKMVVKVYHGGTLQKTLKYDKWPHGDYIQADIHRMLEARYQPVIDNLALQKSSFQIADGTMANYSVEFTEQIGSNDPLLSGTVTASGYAFNASLKYLDWINFDYTDYDLVIGSTKKLLTNSPGTLKIRENEAMALSHISINKITEKAQIKTYDAAGTIINTHTLNNTIYGGLNDGKSQSLDFMCGPYNLNLTGSVITNSVYSYTVQMLDTNDDPVSELFTFIIDRECSRHQLFRLHFLNRLGRFDSFTFTGKHKQTVSYDKEEYQKFTGYTDLSTMEWTNNSYASGTVNFDTRETEVYQISSDWISEEESLWLQELVGSPAVFWQQDPTDSKKTFAVNITENNYEVKKYANKKLFNISITFQLAQPNYRQRA